MGKSFPADPEKTSLVRDEGQVYGSEPSSSGELRGKGKLSWENLTFSVHQSKKQWKESDPVQFRAENGKWLNGTVRRRSDKYASLDWDPLQPPAEVEASRVRGMGKKQILKNVTGNVSKGRLCAIMGPSGSGKTSLLNLLAGRLPSLKDVDGEVLFNGKAIDLLSFRHHVGYVMQDDAITATTTPREALHFAAAVRNIGTQKKREERVSEVLRKLKLMGCQDTIVGNHLLKGLSGGERKRTAIGIELISNPHFLYLDEPTSGLDSYSAWVVCGLLRSLANGEYDGVERTVIATVHQPSSEVFSLFDDVILLSEGRTVYCGPRSKMIAHFEAAGYPSEHGFNPADHVMFAIQMEGDSHTHESMSDVETGKPLLADLWAAKSGSSTFAHVAQSNPRKKRTMEELNLPERPPGSGFLQQVALLGTREARGILRNRPGLIARFGSTIFMNLLVGFVFRAVASDKTDNWVTEEGVSSHFGALVQIGISGMFGLAQPLILAFQQDRPVFLREVSSGAYNPVAFFLSKTATEIPLTLLQACTQYVTAYFLMELRGNFALMVLATAFLGLVAASTALVLSSLARSPEVAIQMAPLVFVPQILFAGFFVATDRIPSFLRWVQYLCSLKYAINLLLIIEFHTLPSSLSPEQRQIALNLIKDGDRSIFKANSVDDNHVWIYIGVLGAAFVAFRVLACFILTHKARKMS